jgi:hypothetical protein
MTLFPLLFVKSMTQIKHKNRVTIGVVNFLKIFSNNVFPGQPLTTTPKSATNHSIIDPQV